MLGSCIGTYTYVLNIDCIYQDYHRSFLKVELPGYQRVRNQQEN